MKQTEISDRGLVRLLPATYHKPPSLRGLVDTDDEMEILAEIEGLTSGRLLAERGRNPHLDPRELAWPHDARAEVTAKATEEIARAKMQAGQILADSEKDIIELALKVAQKIIGRDLQRDPAIVIEICATATEHARAAKAMILKVNPKDGALLRQKRPKLMEQIGRTIELAIRDDADIEQGGCLIQTEFGTIDAQVKTQFDMLRNVLVPDTAKKETK